MPNTLYLNSWPRLKNILRDVAITQCVPAAYWNTSIIRACENDIFEQMKGTSSLIHICANLYIVGVHASRPR